MEPLVWATLLPRLITELPSERVLHPLRIAFNFHGALSVAGLLQDLTARAAFTNARTGISNLCTLADVLNATCPHLPSVIDLRTRVTALVSTLPNANFYMDLLQVSHGSSSPNIAGHSGSLSINLGTDLVASPPLRPPTRKRLANPIERLEDEAFLLAKVPFVDEQDPPTLKSVEFELLGAYKGYAAAKKEANARLEEDIAALGGDESKVQYLYTIWSFRAHAAGTQRETKDRTREAKVVGAPK